MPAKLPDNIKSIVIQQWLRGRPRNDIAAENGLSSGAVTNIVNEWRHNLGFAVPDELRELALTLRKVGITAPQCALGFRVATIMSRIGVSEDSIETFILDVYNRCKNIGQSEGISSYMQDLIEFSARNVMPISKISDYLKEKGEEKQSLEEEITSLNTQISTSKQEKKDCESLRDEALRERNMTVSELKWYSSLKEELKKYSIPVDDISEFARLVKNIRQHSAYDADKVINEFWSLELLRENHATLQRNVDSLRKDVSNLQQQRSALEVYVGMHNQLLSRYRQLETMGFGLRELIFLHNTVVEVAAENDIPTAKAVKKLLSDIEEQYDKKLGFEDKLENMRKEQANLRTQMLLNPLIVPTLSRLMQRGVSEQDIINVAAVIEKYSASANVSSGGSSSDKDKQSLISDLEKYGGLKPTIEHLTQQENILAKNIDFLKNQKQELEQNNQSTFSSYIQLGHTLDFLQGVVFSLRNEISSLAAIYTSMMSLLKLQFHDIGKEQSTHRFNEFSALLRSSKGQDVPFDEIKQDVIKAIEILMNKIGPDDEELSAHLLIAHEALI
jgi:predicted  nucleic acid-binding Zn-ribbon protein